MLLTGLILGLEKKAESSQKLSILVKGDFDRLIIIVHEQLVVDLIMFSNKIIASQKVVDLVPRHSQILTQLSLHSCFYLLALAFAAVKRFYHFK